MSVLMWLLSLITWIPGLILFAIQSSLAGWDWTKDNLWIASAIFIGLFVWITLLSLIALALSAWVKWKLAAGALILGVFFAGAGFGTAINEIIRTKYGTVINLVEVMAIVWTSLFRTTTATGLEVSEAWMALGTAALICLWMLTRRVRAFEVVK